MNKESDPQKQERKVRIAAKLGKSFRAAVRIATFLGKLFRILAFITIISLFFVVVGYIGYLTYLSPVVGLTFIGAIVGLIIGIFLFGKLLEFIETYEDKS